MKSILYIVFYVRFLPSELLKIIICPPPRLVSVTGACAASIIDTNISYISNSYQWNTEEDLPGESPALLAGVNKTAAVLLSSPLYRHNEQT